jgi:hypothetical protein
MPCGPRTAARDQPTSRGLGQELSGAAGRAAPGRGAAPPTERRSTRVARQLPEEGPAVARALGAPLDVIIVRKLGVPFQLYGDFSQTTDDEVIACLEQAAATRIPAAGHRGFHR